MLRTRKTLLRRAIKKARKVTTEKIHLDEKGREDKFYMPPSSNDTPSPEFFKNQGTPATKPTLIASSEVATTTYRVPHGSIKEVSEAFLNNSSAPETGILLVAFERYSALSRSNENLSFLSFLKHTAFTGANIETKRAFWNAFTHFLEKQFNPPRLERVPSLDPDDQQFQLL